MRLDTFLTENYEEITSKNLAQRLIKEKKISINNKIITKNAFKITENNIQNIKVNFDNIYVSRSAYKLKYFLDDNIDIKNKIKNSFCLDIGASTGGFTQILIENEAKKVTALDVGSSQLSESLKNNSKVISIENQDIRNFKSSQFFDIITCDISFISVLKILDSVDKLDFNIFILLFKPQFEVGKNIKRDSNGVVLDKIAIQKSEENFINEIKKLGWEIIKRSESKQKGKEGNLEYIYCIKK
jgi:23S rRNA (cytidine1920-2'-O)/16S rRNA (cytidine1409-2'-O)-methyltransferase